MVKVILGRIILWQAPKIAVLHLLQISHFRSPYRNHQLFIMIKVIAKYYNYLQIFGWFAVLVHTLNNSLTYSLVDKVNPIQTLEILYIVQSLQFLDLLFILLGVTNGSFVSGLMQIVGRNITTHYYMYPVTCFCSLRNALLPWCFAEIIRYSYYINKNLSWLKFLRQQYFNHMLTRYNAFLVLYPMGVLGEIRVINFYVNEITGMETDKMFARGFQFTLVVGLAVLYTHMLKLRSKQYKAQDYPKKDIPLSPKQHKRE